MLQSDALVTQSCHVDQCLLVVEASATSTAEVVHLFALQLALNTFAIGGVADKRQYRTDAFNEQCTLLGLSVVQSDLASESILTSNEMITSRTWTQ